MPHVKFKNGRFENKVVFGLEQLRLGQGKVFLAVVVVEGGHHADVELLLGILKGLGLCTDLLLRS